MAFTLGGTSKGRQRDDFLNAAFRLGKAQKGRGWMTLSSCLYVKELCAKARRLRVLHLEELHTKELCVEGLYVTRVSCERDLDAKELRYQHLGTW